MASAYSCSDGTVWSTPVVDAAFDAWQRYFDLPLFQKLAHVAATPDENTGYTPYTSQALAYTAGEATPPDMVEGYSIGRDDAGAIR